MMQKGFSSGSHLGALRQNAGLSIEQLAAAVNYLPALLRLMESHQGLLRGPIPRKLKAYLTSIRADELRRVVYFGGRGKSVVVTTSLDWGTPCGAKNRRGEPCGQKNVYSNGRCKWHGGYSTGPKTEHGKQRIREGQMRRRARERGEVL